MFKVKMLLSVLIISSTNLFAVKDTELYCELRDKLNILAQEVAARVNKSHLK